MSTYYWEEGKKLETSNKNVQMYLYFWNDERTIITNTNLESESFECSSEMTTNVLKLGSVATKEVSFTFHGDFPDLSGVLFDVVMTGGNRDTDQAFDLPLGQFRVTEDTKSQMTGKRTIKAVDRMNDLINSNADNWLADLDFPILLKDLTKSLYTFLGETVNSTVTSMVNSRTRIFGTAFNSKYLNGVSTGLKVGDVLEAIGEITGCFWGIAPMTQYVGDGTWKDELILLNTSSANDMSYVKGSLEHYEYDTKVVKLNGFTVNDWLGRTKSSGEATATANEYYFINNNALLYGASVNLDMVVSQLFAGFPTAYRTPRIYEMTVPSNPAIKVGDTVTLKDSENNTIFSSFVTRVTHRGIHAMKTEIGCDIDALYVPDRLTNAEDNILIVNGKVDSTNTNLENNYSTTTEMNTAIGNATSGYLPLTGGDLNGALSVKSAQKIIGNGGEYSVLNSDSLNTYASNGTASKLHINYFGGETEVHGNATFDSDVTFNNGLEVANGDLVVRDGADIGSLSVSGTISEGGTRLVDKYAPISNGIAEEVGGRNLLNFAETSRTTFGVTVTSLGSNAFRLSGTCTQTVWLEQIAISLPYGTYTLSNGLGKLQVYLNEEYTRNTVTVTDTITTVKLLLVQGITYNEDYYIMLEQGTVAHTYEPYYQSNAYLTQRTETSINSTSHGGRNLFRGYDVMGNYVEMTGADSKYNGYYTIGSITSFHGAYQSDLVLQSGKQYTISAMVWSDNATTICCSEGDDYNFGNKSIVANTWTKMVWSATGHGLSKVMIENRGNGACHISQFMVEEGSTCHDYEPYILSNRQLTEQYPHRVAHYTGDSTTTTIPLVANSVYMIICTHPFENKNLTIICTVWDSSMNAHALYTSSGYSFSTNGRNLVITTTAMCGINVYRLSDWT